MTSMMDCGANRYLGELVRKTAAGDTSAFKQLYDKTSAGLFALALKMMQDAALAEDVLQDVFVKVWHRASDYHAERGSVVAWLTTMVRYRAIDLLRKNRNRRPADSPTAAPRGDAARSINEGDYAAIDDFSPLSFAQSDEDARHLHECISRLSKTQVQSVSLAFFHGLTHQELSRNLALPLGTIKSRLRRSLLRLKECLTELGVL